METSFIQTVVKAFNGHLCVCDVDTIHLASGHYMNHARSLTSRSLSCVIQEKCLLYENVVMLK